MANKDKNGTQDLNLSRKQFLTRGAFLGGLLMARATSPAFGEVVQNAVLKSKRPDMPYDFTNPENCLYSVCLNCNTGCGIKAKVQDGIVTKIDGSPYNPWSLFPHLPMDVPPDEAVRIDGGLCPK